MKRVREFETHDEGRDVVLHKLLKESSVVLDPRLVDRIVPPAKWDDSAPRDRKPVCLCPILLEQLDVVLPETV